MTIKKGQLVGTWKMHERVATARGADGDMESEAHAFFPLERERNDKVQFDLLPVKDEEVERRGSC